MLQILMVAMMFDWLCTLLSFLDVKFIAVSEPNATNVEGFLKSVYEVYADYVLKNPFYELEMPIRIELFTANVSALLKD